MKIKSIKIFILIILLLTFKYNFTAQFFLDSTFNQIGYRTNLINDKVQISNIALQSDNKIVAVGSTDLLGSTQIIILRFNSDGSLDTGFNGSGQVITSLPSSTASFATDVRIQSDGQIIVVGTVVIDNQNQIVILRYNGSGLSAGSLDTSFNGTGYNFLSNGNGASALSVTLQPDGNIVLCGNAILTDNTSNFIVARYLWSGPNQGEIDTSFGTSGYTLTSIGRNAVALSLAMQATNIILGGNTDNSFALARYDSVGILDNTFGVGGITTTSINNQDIITQILVNSDSTIFGIGYTTINGQREIAIAKYDSNGNIITTWGDSGIITIKLDESVITGRAALQSDGKVVVVGSTSLNQKNIAFVLRINPDGTLDWAPNTGFANGGFLTFDVGNNSTEYLGVLVQPDGNIVAAGNADNNFLIARYLANNSTWVAIDEPSTSTTSDSYIPISGRASEANSKVAIYVNTKLFTIVPTDTSGNWSVEKSPLLLNGSNTIEAKLNNGSITDTKTITSTPVTNKIVINSPADNSMVTQQLPAGWINGRTTLIGLGETVTISTPSGTPTSQVVNIDNNDGSWISTTAVTYTTTGNVNVTAEVTSNPSITTTNTITLVPIQTPPFIIYGSVNVKKNIGDITTGNGYTVEQKASDTIEIEFNPRFAASPGIIATGQSTLGSSTVTIVGDSPVLVYDDPNIVTQKVKLKFTEGTTYVHFSAFNYQ